MKDREAKTDTRLRSAKLSLSKIYKISRKREAEHRNSSDHPAKMPRQRSKKLSAGRNTEKPSAPESDVEELNVSDNESLPVSDKDEDEDELERLVLGDEATFRAQLGMKMDIDQDDEENGASEQDSEADAGIEDVEDADVSALLHVP